MNKFNVKMGSLAFCLIILPIISMTTAARADSTIYYTQVNGLLQDDHINDVTIYNRTGETSSQTLGFDANWWRGVAKTSGNPEDNASANITLSGAQTDRGQRIRVGIAAPGETGTARFQTSLDGGETWSATIYTTQSSAQNLEFDGVDSGLDITFAAGADWTFNDTFTLASWWGEGASSTRSAAREFPQKAAIIVTGVDNPPDVYTGGVEIIDLSDNTIWMRFAITGREVLPLDQNLAAGPVHSVAAVNGKIILGGESGNMSGVAVIDLAADSASFFDTSPGWEWGGNLARRNDGSRADTGWVAANPALPSLTSSIVRDVDAGVVSGHTYVAVATGNLLDLMRDFDAVYYNLAADCQGDIATTAIVGDDLYWANGAFLCAKYDFDSVPSSGAWPPVIPYSASTHPELISNDVRAIAGRSGGSPLEASSNIVYIGTGQGLTILHEDQGPTINGETFHYGWVGSANPNIDYKILTGMTDAVSAIDIANGYSGVYVATNDFGGFGGLSVLRPRIQPGDVPFLLASYRYPALLSNDVSALAHGSDLIVGSAGNGVTRVGDAPTAVGLTRLVVQPPQISRLALGLAIGLMSAGLIAAAILFHKRRQS